MQHYPEQEHIPGIMGKVIRYSEYRAMVKQVYQERKGKVAGAFAAAALDLKIARITLGERVINAVSIIGMRDEAPQQKFYVAAGKAAGAGKNDLYINAYILIEHISNKFFHDDETRNILQAAVRRTPDCVEMVKKGDLVPYKTKRRELI